MYECSICLAKIKKRNKNKHQQSKKHRYFFSNMIVNKNIVKNNDINKCKDIFQSYCDEHKKKFNEFTVMNIWKKNDMIKKKSQFHKRLRCKEHICLNQICLKYQYI